MDEHDIEGGRINAACIHHRLKLLALVVSGTCAGIDILSHDVPAPRVAMLSRLRDLIGNRDIVLSLPRCRYARVNRNPLAHSEYPRCCRSLWAAWILTALPELPLPPVAP